MRVGLFNIKFCVGAAPSQTSSSHSGGGGSQRVFLRQSGQLRRTPRREVVAGVAVARAWPLRQSTWKVWAHSRTASSVVTGQRGSRQMLQSSTAEEEDDDDDDEEEEGSWRRPAARETGACASC